ncbi:borealin [Diprion similis]|uniref:borealin n=1 Tax=Diprion similis TaxID=362088 RepID=UPI001EF81DAC|nr:borealin [Diprion similis]
MPRTKHVRKTKSIEAGEDGGLLLKDFEKQVQLRLHKMQVEFEGRLNRIDTHYRMASSRLPQSLAKLTLRDIIRITSAEDGATEECEVSSSIDVDETMSPTPRTVRPKRASKRTTTASDDGYATEVGTTTSTRTQNSLAVPATSTKTRKMRTRSSSASRKTKLSEINTAPKTSRKEERGASSAIKNKFKTPAPMLKPHGNEYALVTPKVKPNTPLSVMRRPRQGEMALSMQGSPLLVTSVVNENVANVNVPLENGRVLSLLPNDGLRLSYLPEFDAETRRQLVTLKQHLDKVIGS